MSVAILVALIALVTYAQFSGTDRPATIAVRSEFEQVRAVDGVYYLPVTVMNSGDRTAEDVHVRLRLSAGAGEPETAEVTFSFLAGGEKANAVAAFRHPPTPATLSHSISFIEP